MIIYIAGPMTGKDNYNREGFTQAHIFIESKGHTPLNPAKLPRNLDDKKYLPICMTMIDAADAVYMLDGWEDSLGAKAEIAYARRQGKAIIYQGAHL